MARTGTIGRGYTALTGGREPRIVRPKNNDPNGPWRYGPGPAETVGMSEMTRQPMVRLRDGAVRGTAGAGGSAFLGIPYAAAPFETNRMRAPQPVVPWDGEREAKAFCPTVPNGDHAAQYVQLFTEGV